MIDFTFIRYDNRKNNRNLSFSTEWFTKNELISLCKRNILSIYGIWYTNLGIMVQLDLLNFGKILYLNF